MRTPNVLTISPAVPFIDTFVRAFLTGEVVPGFEPLGDPLRLAEATIFVPTQRSAAALAAAFAAQAGTTSSLLPRILPLGALEAVETELLFADPEPGSAGLPLPPAASPIWRRLQLTTLIQGWAAAVQGALCRVDHAGAMVIDASEPFRVATSAVDAFALAGDLARLIDELRIEGVAWKAFDALRMAAFDDYWRITTTFLSIAIDLWPKILAEHGRVDPSARQIGLVDAQAARLADPTQRGPVVAIGSTGTNKATARLLAAIARAPQGAVVLPGLDLALDDAAWALVSGRLDPGQEPSFGHPQAAMARLLPTLNVTRADVRTLGAADDLAETRARFVAEALRPADTTDRWRAYRRMLTNAALGAALEGISLVEAADEREEALCLAIAMREVLETPGRTAALVTPDRELARRVRGELLRWTIEVFDTGGEPLSNRPLGILSRLVIAAAANGMAAADLSALLAHPLAAFGKPRAEIARRAAQLEVGVLRTVPIAGRAAEAIFADARAAAADRHAHPTQKAIRPPDWAALADVWAVFLQTISPLTSLAGSHPLGTWVAAHRDVVAAVAGETAGEIADDEADALDRLFDELGPMAAGPLHLDAKDYALFFGRLAGEVVLRNTERPHPRLQIYGLLEARLMRADVMILGGLDETIWPPQTTTDAFLNRPMRHELGLTPPERRIGQTAHDFMQAMGNRSVVLSRARKRGGAPCVASRFLLRLEALGGKAWEACRARGKRLLFLASAIDRPEHAAPVTRPRPTPPIELRPTRLSVTQIETLRRDPYAIFASHILGLAALPQIGAELAPSAFGSLMHEALHCFVKGASPEEGGTARRVRLMRILENAFAVAREDPVFCAHRWPIVLKAAEVFLGFDDRQRARLDRSLVETDGRTEIVLADQSTFMLTARADRIDFHRDGSALLVDYKTGRPPGTREVEVGFAPQLTLEAAILRAGGFGGPHDGAIEATYLKLGGRDGGFERPLDFPNTSFGDVVDRHMGELNSLLSQLRSADVGYPSRPYPKFAKDYGDYDHLARVREWSLVTDEEVSP